jgi:D-alanyl-D-alanine carboxypeptidase
MVRSLPVALALLTSAVPFAAAASRAEQIVADPLLEAIIDPLVAPDLARGVPGLSIAVMQGGEILFAKGYGLAEIEHEVAVTPATIFRIASVTKQFTAAAIVKQVEAGALAFDDAISEHVAGLSPDTGKVTIRQLLDHTSGIPSYTGLGEEWEAKKRLDFEPSEIIDLVRGKPLEFPPGSRFSYNNSGYVLLGMILEAVSGKGYDRHVEEDLLAGLGLETIVYGHAERILKNRAQGYSRRDGQVRNDEALSMTQPYAAGSLCATATDLVRWSDLLFDGGIVSSESLAAMTTATVLPDGTSTGYGFGLAIGELEGERCISHGGGIDGFTSMLASYPDHDVHIAVLANGDFLDPGRIERAIARRVLGLPDVEVLDLPIDEALRAALAGDYGAPDLDVTIRIAGDTLICAPAGQATFRLMRQRDRHFLAEGEPEIKLTFEPSRAAADPAPGFLLEQPGIRIPFVRK